MLRQCIEATAACVLAVDVLVVFFSVVWRYFLHDPVDWAEEVARALLMLLVFLGASIGLAKGQHLGIDTLRGLLPERGRNFALQCCNWVVLVVAGVLTYSGAQLMLSSRGQITPFGLPQMLLVAPVLIGGLLFLVFSSRNLANGPRPVVLASGLAVFVLGGVVVGMQALAPTLWPGAGSWMLLSFLFCLMGGVPIAFALAFSSAVYFTLNPTLPVVVYSQQVAAGADHFVLLAIPFFVLAGLVMEVNGMSARLIELLVRGVGRMRGGINLIMITAVAFFSGISGSKLADVAAVGGIMMPAVRRCQQDENEAAGLLASTAVMAETIPPCINLIIFGFVANVSIGGLFIAGLVPAAFLAVALGILAVIVGTRADPEQAFPNRRRMLTLVAGAMVGLLMILMIGKGVTSGVATSTEVSAFAVVYALVVGGLAFRELTWRSVYRLFVDSAALAGTILFIVAAASSLSYALTIEQIPQGLAAAMVNVGHTYGVWLFLLISIGLLVVFGAVLEGAPALIIFGPLLTPIAAQLGMNPLHYGIVLVIAMGLGLFSPPLGLGLYATCAVTGTRMADVARPMAKYLAVLFVALLVIAFVPALTLWLPGKFGFQ
ncbi:MAG: TRAP transporter large permease subunit [Betaproteobacteria bacterium]